MVKKNTKIMDFKILDCTLRDGGYLNNWDFSEKEIISIINSLEDNNVEEIEISYLSKIKDIDYLLKLLSNKAEYFFMINFLELNYLNIKDNLNIRIALKKNHFPKLKNFLNISENLYIQVMNINYYSEKELLEIIDICNNSRNIKALYIVDSFGSLLPKDIEKYYLMIDKNLRNDMSIGLHLHNNNGLALLNVFTILEKNIKNRNLIIDSTLLGIGRGGGNLKTESLLLYQNKLNIKSLIKVYENILIDKFKNIDIRKNVIEFLTGIYSVHQNYSKYFYETNFSLLEIENILINLTEEEKINFNLFSIK